MNVAIRIGITLWIAFGICGLVNSVIFQSLLFNRVCFLGFVSGLTILLIGVVREVWS